MVARCSVGRVVVVGWWWWVTGLMHRMRASSSGAAACGWKRWYVRIKSEALCTCVKVQG